MTTNRDKRIAMVTGAVEYHAKCRRIKLDIALFEALRFLLRADLMSE